MRSPGFTRGYYHSLPTGRGGKASFIPSQMGNGSEGLVSALDFVLRGSFPIWQQMVRQRLELLERAAWAQPLRMPP